MDPKEPVHSLPEARDQTKSRLRDLGRLVSRYARQHFASDKPTPRASTSAPPAATSLHATALRYLRIVPFLLTTGFAASFFWDFPGWQLYLAGLTLQLDGLLRMVSVSGLIGFGTNWLAITMLFQPRKPRPLFGQGLLPAQRERIAHRLAGTISEELINEHTIAEAIQKSRIIETYRNTTLQVVRGVLEDPAFRKEAKALTADYVEEVLRSPAVRDRLVDLTLDKIEQHSDHGLAGLALKAYRYFREDELVEEIDKAIRELPDKLDIIMDGLDEFLDRVPDTLEQHAQDVEQTATRAILHFVEQINIREMILDNLRRYEEEKLERLLKTTSNEQLNYIKYLGGILGSVGGLIIWQPVLALLGLGSLAASLYLLDEALYRMAAANKKAQHP